MELGDFRMGDKNATPASDAKGGCCGTPTGCQIDSDGCLHKVEKAQWQIEAAEEVAKRTHSVWTFNGKQVRWNDDKQDWEPADLCPTCKETLPCATCGAGL